MDHPLTSHYPHLLAPLDLGFTHAAQPRADGLDAHRARGRSEALRPPRRLLRRARARRRRADRHRRLRAEHRRLGRAVRRPAHDAARPRRSTGRSPTAVHAEGGKIALQILHTGRYGYHPLAVAPSRLKSPISPFTPRALSSPRRRAPDPRLRALRRARARGGLRRRRGDGLRGLLHQPVPGRATPTSAPTTGAAATRTACACRSRSCAHARGGRAATSSSSTACRCSTWSRTAAAGTRSCSWRRRSSARARRSSTPASAGTRRACRPSPPRCRARPSPG